MPDRSTTGSSFGVSERVRRTSAGSLSGRGDREAARGTAIAVAGATSGMATRVPLDVEADDLILSGTDASPAVQGRWQELLTMREGEVLAVVESVGRKRE